LTERVRCLRRYRLNSTLKNKPSVEICYASDLLSYSASTLIGKVLDFSETELPPSGALKPSSILSKSHTLVDDDMSDISVSSVENEFSDSLKNSSLEYVWILGMQFVVFDSSIANIY
jgi:hypothetical protein